MFDPAFYVGEDVFCLGFQKSKNNFDETLDTSIQSQQYTFDFFKISEKTWRLEDFVNTKNHFERSSHKKRKVVSFENKKRSKRGV